MEERMKLSCSIHAWRESLGVSRLLQQPPPHFDWFQQHLVLRPLLKTAKGHMVVLLKVRWLWVDSCGLLIIRRGFKPALQQVSVWRADS
jgi:hypothetical protein